MKDKTIFKATIPMKAIIRIDDPNKSDRLDSLLLKKMTVDELNILRLALPKWSTAYLRTHMEIESRIKAGIVEMESVFGPTLRISNIDVKNHHNQQNSSLM